MILKQKTSFREVLGINGQLPTFALACARLSSARPRFTSEFGKGSGSSAAYMPPKRWLTASYSCEKKLGTNVRTTCNFKAIGFVFYLGLNSENEVVGNQIKDYRYRHDREHKCPDFKCGFNHRVRYGALLHHASSLCRVYRKLFVK